MITKVGKEKWSLFRYGDLSRGSHDTVLLAASGDLDPVLSEINTTHHNEDVRKHRQRGFRG